MPTPAFITDAAARGLADGETFYTWQGGIPELRQALARYHARHFGKSFAEEEFLVTVGGMQAIQLAMQATVAGSGDEVDLPVAGLAEFRRRRRCRRRGCRLPVSARPVRQWLVLRRRQDRGRGHAAHQGALRQLAVQPDRLDRRSGKRCRRSSTSPASSDLWIIADEIYALFHFGGRAPPPSWTSWPRRTASSSSTLSPRTGR